jgi:diguanylate cyclase (GGDEF)-like protein
VAQNRKPIVNGNPSVEPGYLNDPNSFSTLRSALAVPLQGLSGVVGVLALYQTEKNAFTSDHLRILLAVSSKMALAIENALKFQQAETSAVTDYLTELPNARSLFLQLDRELARCKRDASALRVLVCDMDGFKQVNDRFGHLIGNRVLQWFARSLRESSREYDYVARMGGDEFVLVAPGLTSEAAAKKTEQLREQAKQAGREICGEEILTLSVGQAVFPDDGEDAEELLAEADRRMYVDKQQQPQRKNRRLHPRMKTHSTIELRPLDGTKPILGNVTNISLNGCYVETTSILDKNSKLTLTFSMEDGELQVCGEVMRVDPGSGIAIQFPDASREHYARMQKILESVQRMTLFYYNRNMSTMLPQ